MSAWGVLLAICAGWTAGPGIAHGEAARADASPRIAAPQAHAVVHSNSGDVPVVVSGVPPAALLLPVLDGRPGALHHQAAFALHGVDRGDHTLQVRLQDAKHRPLGETPPVVFHVWHASRR